MGQLVYTMFTINNPTSFHLWWKKTGKVSKKFSKYCAHDCNSYFHNYKSSARILRQPCVLRNPKRIKILLWQNPIKEIELSSSIKKHYHSAIHEIISGTSKFEKLYEDPTLKPEASLQRFLLKLKQKKVLWWNWICWIVSFWFCSCSYLWYS